MSGVVAAQGGADEPDNNGGDSNECPELPDLGHVSAHVGEGRGSITHLVTGEVLDIPQGVVLSFSFPVFVL